MIKSDCIHQNTKGKTLKVQCFRHQQKIGLTAGHRIGPKRIGIGPEQVWLTNLLTSTEMNRIKIVGKIIRFRPVPLYTGMVVDRTRMESDGPERTGMGRHIFQKIIISLVILNQENMNAFVFSKFKF